MPASLSRVAVLLGAFAAPSALAMPLHLPFAPAGSKTDLDGKLEFLDVERAESANPYQNPQGKLRLHLTTDFGAHVRFVADVTGTAGGTPRNPSGAGVYDFGHVKQDLSPSLEFGEAYLLFETTRFDLRVGLQRFAWGVLDEPHAAEQAPNDLLSPQKFYEPLLEEENDRKVGVPALAPTVYLPSSQSRFLPSDARLTFVWLPIYVPYLFPDQDERWYPPLARVPPESDVMGITVENESRFVNAPVPSRTLSHGTYAVRLAGLAAGADFALYYFDGFDPSPSLDAAAQGFVRLDPLSPQRLDARSEVDVFPAFHRIRTVGGDVAYRLLGATLRLEGAYVFDRGYVRNLQDVVASEQIGTVDPASLLGGQEQPVTVTLSDVNVQRDAVEWGAGGDGFIGSTFVLVQMNQTAVLHNQVNLLISDMETRFSTVLRRSFLEDHLRAELLGLYGMQGVYGVAHPRLTYAVNDHLDVRIGFVAIAGHEESAVGQYRRNDEGYVRVRFLF
jgi:hypothetical protein